MTVWFITGASRGFGLEIARQALARGDRVVATARRPGAVTAALPDAGDALLALELDVVDAEQARRAVAAAVATFGRIDVLVNNAGRGLLGAIEEVDDAAARAVFDVNVFGLLNVTRAALPVLRRQGAGLVVTLSSVAGFVARPGWGVYAATKFAAEAITEGLGRELAHLGVRTIVIEPSAFRTDFLDGASLSAAATVIEDYEASVGPTRAWAASANHEQAGDPVKAARIIVGLAESAHLPERLQLGTESFAAVAEKIARTAHDQVEWRAVSESTGFDDPAARPGRS